MKQIALLGFLFMLIACSDRTGEDLPVDLSGHNMKLLPEKPTSSDQIKLVIFDDCTYNTLSGITQNGSTIDIKKQFNGMMKWPCIMKNDTILIGILPKGSYNVNYTLIDISQSSPQNISLSFSFLLNVSK
jgi:hypothetical protein